MKKFRIQITYESDGLKKAVVLRKKFCRISDGIDYFKKIVPTAEKIISAMLLV